MDALRAAGLEEADARRGRARAPVPRHLRRHADAVRRQRGDDPASPASASSRAPVRWIPADVKRPQMQWNVVRSIGMPTIRCSPASASEPWVYFVHSLHGVSRRSGRRRRRRASTAARSTPRSAPGNVFAAQFHPEKSGAAGLRPARQLRRIVSRDVGVIELYPAIDLRGGRVVRLRPGRLRRRDGLRRRPGRGRRRRSPTPAAPWIHVVDLDAARSGDAGQPAGRRGDRRCGRRARRGADRWRSAHGRRRRGAGRRRRRPRRDGLGGGRATRRSSTRVGRLVPVAVGLDHRGGELAVHGWTEGSRRHARRGARPRIPAASAFVITDIARDGMLGRARRRRARRLRRRDRPPGDRQRRSGDRSTTSPRSPAIAGLAGVITGKALYEGRFTVADAIAALDGAGAPMRVARVIPCLDVTGGRVVKGTNFVDLRDAGDPVELAARYDAEGADELVFLDITASSDGRDTTVDMVVPHGRAGVHPVHGRRRHPHASTTPGGMLRAGADKVSVNTAAVAAARADRRDRRRVRRAVRRVRDRRQAARRRRLGLRGVPARRAHADRHRRGRVGRAGRRARRRRDPADVDGPRRHPRRASTSSSPAPSPRPSACR